MTFGYKSKCEPTCVCNISANIGTSLPEVQILDAITAGCLNFHPMAQCVVHALMWLAVRVPLRLARVPRTASSAQRSHRLRLKHAAAPVLLAHNEVKKT